MHAETIVEVEPDGRGGSRVGRLRCEAPLLVRTTADDDGRLVLLLVGGAAGPLSGDELLLRVRVADGASVIVRSVAASLAQPGPRGGRSRSTVLLDLGESASLDWAPQPTIAVRGCDHEATVVVHAHGTSRLRLVETVSLGRHDEPPGTISLRLRLTVDGVPTLDHRTDLAPGSLLGPGAHGPGRTARSELLLGPGSPATPSTQVCDGIVTGTFPVGPGCALTVARLRDSASWDRLVDASSSMP